MKTLHFIYFFFFDEHLGSFDHLQLHTGLQRTYLYMCPVYMQEFHHYISLRIEIVGKDLYIENTKRFTKVLVL